MPRPSKPKSVRYATLKEGASESETTKYYTTYKDIKKWFKYINDVVFDGKLAPFNDIVIKDLRRQKCYGQVTQWEWKRKGTCVFHLEMNTCYKTKRQFIDTLAHEIVHLYQMRNAGDSGNHNNFLFYSFAPKMKRAALI